MKRSVAVAAVGLLLAACVTTNDPAGPSKATASVSAPVANPTTGFESSWSVAPGNTARGRPVGGPHTVGVMAMDWPSEIAPLEPVQRRLNNRSVGSLPTEQFVLGLMPVANSRGDHIDKQLVKALFDVDSGADLLTSLDFARDRVMDDSLSTQFLLVYSRLLARAHGYQDSVAQTIIVADITTIIDSARCEPGTGDEFTGLFSGRRDFADLYEIARNYIAGADAQRRRDLAEGALLMERRTAPIRRDENLCRYGMRYMDRTKLTKTECSIPRANQTCYAGADNPAVPTRWADEDRWRKMRIDVLEEMTPEKIIEIYSKPLPQAM